MHRFICFLSVISCLECDVCQRQCDDNLAECLAGCDGVPTCMSTCSRDLVQCEDECTAKCGKHIELLVLNPNKDEQLHINLKPGGEEIITEIKFAPSYDDRHWMCSFTLFGKMYLIGGNDGLASERRQLQVTIEGIQVLDQLPFRFNDGRCLNYDDEHVLACAGDFGYQKECFKFDGANYTRMAHTQFDHYRGGMARWRSQALIMGGYYNGAGTVELFDDSTNHWSRLSENEMFEKFYGFTAVGVLDTVFTFGGALRRESVVVNHVYKMDKRTFKFARNEQDLSTYRYGHRSVLASDTIIHIGGDGRKAIECWTVTGDGDGDQFNITSTEFVTNVWLGYAEAFELT